MKIKKTQLLVLSGGFGSRLKKVVPDVPKALAPIHQKNFLFYFLKNWWRHGIRNIVFLLHYKSEMIISYIENNKKNSFFSDLSFKFIIEEQPLGTGGSVKHAINKLDIKNNFLLTNSDTYIENFSAILNDSKTPSIAIVNNIKNACRFGHVTVRKNRIIKIEEKNNDKPDSYQHNINAGIYLLDPNLFSKFTNKPASLEKDYLPNLITDIEFKAIILKSKFFDIGVPKDYLKFQNWILTTNNDF